MKRIQQYAPMIFRLTSSVGDCGTNNPKEVKIVQQQLIDAGYAVATGRHIYPTGNCNIDTIEAIRWYQRLLNLSPSGLINATDIWFMQALEEASTPHWRPKNVSGPLQVSIGQMTFDAEGSDYITAVAPFRQNSYPFFSRILHWPEVGGSGVTLGRGYDMGSRSSGEILSTLRQAGIEEYKAQLCAKAAGLKNREASQFVGVYGPFVGEITHQQQIRLFEISYREKIEYSKGVYSRQVRRLRIINALAWNSLDPAIRDSFIDTLFQGNITARKMVKIMAEGGGRQEVIDYLRSDSNLSRDSRRTNIRVRNLQ
ncbi:peptidoglycan-binding protein [Kosakonia sp. BYX6]|uniref:Peptidoglycan-binding protein n=1 Tax=Kosakonia calanthes TaxID=3139408 RepID=A0ABZ3BD47_9ENTR